MHHAVRWVAGALAALMVAAVAVIPATAQEAGKLKVTVEYKGTGTVDASHELFLWVFDTPQITADSVPIASEVLTSNGAAASFSGLPKEVYIAAAFDEKGDYDGTSGPPPSGTPIVIYGDAGAARPVPSGGADATVVVSFDGSVRMP